MLYLTTYASYLLCFGPFLSAACVESRAVLNPGTTSAGGRYQLHQLIIQNFRVLYLHSV